MNIRLGILSLAIGLLCCSCSTRRNTAATRQYTAFITRYNVYYNGDEHYRNTLKSMEESYEDDFSRMLYPLPAEAKADPSAPVASGDFTPSIEKAQKAIQLRSIRRRPKRKPGHSKDQEYQAWLKRDEYNPFIHNAWLLLGKSQFMNGDFKGAASTFLYITKHFTWLPDIVVEARIRQAMSYVADGALFEAESTLSRVRVNKITDRTTLALYYTALADLKVRSREYDSAIPALRSAIGYTSGLRRTRLYYLLGQSCRAAGMNTDAYDAFDRAARGSGSYRFKINARVSRSEVAPASDADKEIKRLKSMLRYRRNEEFGSLINYALGNLLIARKDSAEAIVHYRRALGNGAESPLAGLKLGEIYYSCRQYSLAQPCYSEALPLIDASSFPGYDSIRRRADILDELALYHRNVELQDSLIRLADMPSQQRMEVINRHIGALKERERKEADEARRREYLANIEAQGLGLQQPEGTSQAPMAFSSNTDNSWYFYNPAIRAAGSAEFQRRWGNRRLEDNWRRHDRTMLAFGESHVELSDSVSDIENRSDESLTPDLYNPQYYLRQLPLDPASRASAENIIIEGLYNMGVIFKDRIGDYHAADSCFSRLLADFPDNIYRLDSYQNLHLMAIARHDHSSAERYRHFIIDHFPSSSLASTMRHPDYMERMIGADSISAGMYEQAYRAFLANDNLTVHRLADEVNRLYPSCRVIPKFLFLDAMAYVPEGNADSFSHNLDKLISLYPDADVTPLAADYLSQLRRGRKLQSGGNNPIRLLLPDDTVSHLDTYSPFELATTDGEQIVMFAYSRNSLNANELIFNIARFNFSAYTVRDFELRQIDFGNLGLLLVYGFNSPADAERYRRKLISSIDPTLPADVMPLIISTANFDLLIKQGRSIEEYLDALDRQNIIDTQEKYDL